MGKVNCWEYKKCGREPDGVKVDKLGICPSSKEKVLDGTHDGKNAGRACWIVAGTMCGGKPQGTFALKYNNCQKCDFYKTVKEDEGVDLEISIVLLDKLRSYSNEFYEYK